MHGALTLTLIHSGLYRLYNTSTCFRSIIKTDDKKQIKTLAMLQAPFLRKKKKLYLSQIFYIAQHIAAV